MKRKTGLADVAADVDANKLDNKNTTLLEELRRLETELHKNETRCNRERMERLLHPDFVGSADQEGAISSPRSRRNSAPITGSRLCILSSLI